jgi:hypothetical protein
MIEGRSHLGMRPRNAHSFKQIVPDQARSHLGADLHLKGFRGLLQVDGYAGFGRLVTAADGTVSVAFCWAHTRRKAAILPCSGDSLNRGRLPAVGSLPSYPTGSRASSPDRCQRSIRDQKEALDGDAMDWSMALAGGDRECGQHFLHAGAGTRGASESLA